MRVSTSLLLAAILTACAPDNHTGADHEAATDTAIVDGGLVVSAAKIRPPLPGKTMTAGYFTLTNSGPADRLIAAESDIAGQVELHTHLMEDGIMKMRRVDGVNIPENDQIIFMPGSYHLMMFDLDLSENQTDASITLKFEHAPEMTFIAEIADPVLDRPVKHEGH